MGNLTRSIKFLSFTRFLGMFIVGTLIYPLSAFSIIGILSGMCLIVFSSKWIEDEKFRNFWEKVVLNYSQHNFSEENKSEDKNSEPPNV